jgi:hypothetical protein
MQFQQFQVSSNPDQIVYSFNQICNETKCLKFLKMINNIKVDFKFNLLCIYLLF